VIVFDDDLVGISVLPPKRHPVLVIHADAVPPAAGALLSPATRIVASVATTAR
jgi:hypothetical protein